MICNKFGMLCNSLGLLLCWYRFDFFYCILMVINLIWVFYGIDYFYLNDWFEFYFFVRIFCLFGDNCVCLEIEFSIVYKLKRVYNEKKYEIFN